MSVRPYLPSAQFIVIALAVFVSGSLVAAAQYYSSKTPSANLASAQNGSQTDAWEQSLEEIQAQSGISIPDAPPEETIEQLLADAQSDNLTDTIGRQILVRLTSAGVQGLGSDIPTQESIIAQATAQMNASQKSPKTVSLYTIEPSEAALRTYGNSVMQAVMAHPGASSEATLLAIARVTDNQDASQARTLSSIGAEYRAIADKLASLSVPQTISPLHMQATQNIYTIADTFIDMQVVLEDPLRGVVALQRYQLLMGETGRIFTNIADYLNKSGILFSKDEPGSAWQTLLPAS